MERLIYGFLFLTGCFVGAILCAPQPKIEIERKEIKSYVENSSLEESEEAFVLGVEKTSEGSYYCFNIKNDSEFFLQKIDKDNIRVIKANITNPYIEGCFNSEGEPFCNKDEVKEEYWKCDSSHLKSLSSYKLYVPENTIELAF